MSNKEKAQALVNRLAGTFPRVMQSGEKLHFLVTRQLRDHPPVVHAVYIVPEKATYLNDAGETCINETWMQKVLKRDYDEMQEAFAEFHNSKFFGHGVVIQDVSPEIEF